MAAEKDVVLVIIEDTPVTFARIETIAADVKKDWYHVKLLFLQIPLQAVTWILKNDYINGSEFHMGGKRMRLAPVECPPEFQIDHSPDGPSSADKEKPFTTGGSEHAEAGKVVSLADFKKNRNQP